MKRLTEPRTSRRSSRWTLLLVDENGRTIRVRGFHFFAWLAAILFLGLLVATGATFYLLRLERAESQRLRQAVAASAEALRRAPVARPAGPRPSQTVPSAKEAPSPVVSTEPAPDRPAPVPEPDPDRPVPAANPSAPASASEPVDSRSPPDRVFSAAPAESSPENAAPSGPPVVAVEKVAFSESDGYGVEFRLRNTAPDGEAISGHVVVVARMSEGGWAALPEVPLVEGRPTGKAEGETFSIQNYRPMRFRAGPELRGDRVRGATAFVFDAEGRLLLETPLTAESE
ncbi:MAG: hypothetical protein ACLFRG_16630 [Desulfococcaceae bacterium]